MHTDVYNYLINIVLLLHISTTLVVILWELYY